MRDKNFPIVLYWIAGGIPTHDDRVAAAAFGPGVRFRNADHDTKDGSQEECDYVAGPDIPTRYTDEHSTLRKPAAVPYTEWMQRKMDMVQRGLAKPGDEQTVKVAQHGGPDGKGGTLPPKIVEVAPSLGINRPANAPAPNGGKATDEFGFTRPGMPGYRDPGASQGAGNASPAPAGGDPFAKPADDPFAAPAK